MLIVVVVVALYLESVLAAAVITRCFTKFIKPHYFFPQLTVGAAHYAPTKKTTTTYQLLQQWHCGVSSIHVGHGGRMQRVHES